MIWFLLIFGTIAVLLFVASIFMIKIRQRREKDATYDSKWTKFENKWDPYYNFFHNLFWWVFAFLIIFFVYLR